MIHTFRNSVPGKSHVVRNCIRQIDWPWKQRVIHRCRNVSDQAIRNRASAGARLENSFQKRQRSSELLSFSIFMRAKLRWLSFPSTFSSGEYDRSWRHFRDNDVLNLSRNRTKNGRGFATHQTLQRPDRQTCHFVIIYRHHAVICASIIYADAACSFP